MLCNMKILIDFKEKSILTVLNLLFFEYKEIDIFSFKEGYESNISNIDFSSLD